LTQERRGDPYVKEETMKCGECGFEAPLKEFRYLYNARIDASMSLRQCPKCQSWIVADELSGEAVQTLGAGEAPWGKSAGIEGLAKDALP
jgi:hypothetical protein